MENHKISDIIAVVIICLVSITLTAYGKKQPEYSEGHAKEYFKEHYNFELPESSKVIHCQ